MTKTEIRNNCRYAWLVCILAILMLPVINSTWNNKTNLFIYSNMYNLNNWNHH